MTIFQFFNDWIGAPAGYDYVIIAIAGAAGLIVLDNLLRALFGVISSLFKKWR